MDYQLYIFDLDDTLIHEGFNQYSDAVRYGTACDDTLKILQRLKACKVKTAIASNNYNAAKILRFLNLYEYFDLIVGHSDNSCKANHLTFILSHFSGIPKSEIVFYDDYQENIETAKSMNIQSVLVDWKTGVNWEDVFPSLCLDRLFDRG